MDVSKNCRIPYPRIRIIVSMSMYRCFVGYDISRSSKSSEFRGRRELLVIVLKSPPHLKFFFVVQLWGGVHDFHWD